jgi:hypothetical protein
MLEGEAFTSSLKRDHEWRTLQGGPGHRWALMVKKNIDWIDTDNRLTAKNID